jgi:hypothetical protein
VNARIPDPADGAVIRRDPAADYAAMAGSALITAAGMAGEYRTRV